MALAYNALALADLNEKTKKGVKIRVAFFVIYDSVFPARPLFDRMLEDDAFAPFILVIPDISRGEENMFAQMDKASKTLSQKYDSVVSSYDKTEKEFIDFTPEADLICSACPYSSMTFKYYTMEWCQKKLSIYIPYGYTVSNWYERSEEKRFFFWKTFVANRWQFRSVKYGAEILGYVKMDALANFYPAKRDRKRIIIAPHHTVGGWTGGVEFSNFIRYADFFLNLPRKYPEIDFVFRPHPLLFVNLEKEDIWNRQRIQKYLGDMQSNTNVVYDTAAEYFQTFVDSDALIHDCGSFMAEYLFVGKPACYLLKDEQKNANNFNDFASECLERHYKAYVERDIMMFINDIIADNDTMRERRNTFVHQELKMGYPYAADHVLRFLKVELGLRAYERDC